MKILSLPASEFYLTLYFLGLLEIQFDYLKSLEIEEKINKIRWCQTANGALFLLSTNDKTIKFWKVAKTVSICNVLMIFFHIFLKLLLRALVALPSQFIAC